MPIISEISLTITLMVLGAALLHATWNVMIKGSGDPQFDTALITMGAGASALPFIGFVAPPAPESWPYLAASLAVHMGYYIALVGAYRHGDLSHAYPLMRGIAPLIVVASSALVVGEWPGPGVMLGVVLISIGVIGIGWFGLKSALPHGRATAWALANAVIIATYTLIDARGVRLSGSAWGYELWMFVFDIFPFALMVWWQRGHAFARYVRLRWLRGLAGGACSATAYGIALWAMTRAPVAAVAALRETSVIFAALLATLVLRESFGRYRIASACIVTAGVIALRL